MPEDLQQAIAGPAQGIGVGGAAGPLPLGVDAQQQLQPFGQGHHRTGLGARQGIAGAPGQVVLEHGQGHGPGFAFRQQVFAAHHPLELGEFAHHLADQVVLAEVGGAAGMGGVLVAQLQQLHQPIRAPLESFDPVEQGAEPLGEGDPGQLDAAIAAGDRPVRGHKKLGIGQARLEHPLVAAPHRVRGGGQAIGDTEEGGQQAGAGIEGQGVDLGLLAIEGDVALVGAHHRAEHLGRQGQVGLGHRAFDQQWRLHQVGEFIEELLG